MKAFIIMVIVWMSWRSMWTRIGLGINAYPFTREHTAGKAVVKVFIAAAIIIWGLFLVLR